MLTKRLSCSRLCVWCVLFSLFALLVLSSCGMKATRTSFTKALDDIDGFISTGQSGEALTQLRKVEKRAGDPFSRIGIFRRYMALGEKIYAERTLKKAVRRFRTSSELHAVYAHFLLRAGRVDEAMSIGKVLQGTKYGSIYSEAYLTKLFNKERDDSNDSKFVLPWKKEREDIPLSFSCESFFPIYYDAYVGTQLPYWLRNCALIRLLEGNYNGAMDMAPDYTDSVLDAYFWALVSFDTMQFGRAAYLAQRAEELLENSDSGRTLVSPLEVTAILSDAYMSQGDDDRAEEARRVLLGRLGDGSDEATSSDEMRDRLLPVIYLDSALYSEKRGNDARCLDLLLSTVDTWQDYVPALIAYADFARRTSAPLVEDEQETALRRGGVRTLRMEKYDSRPRAAVSDAKGRMEASLERVYDAQLYIALIDLRYATDKTLTTENKIADVWSELEKSATGTNTYPPMLLEFAVNKLLNFGEEADAWTLFRKSVMAERGFDPKRDFYEQCAENVRSLTVSEAEYAAYFAVKAGMETDAKRILDYCVYESGGIAGGSDARTVSAFVSTPTCMNLAMVCSSTGDKRKALDVYAASSGRTVDAHDKAEAMRRMAAIYTQLGSVKEARQSLGYALTLDPHNMKAKLLRDRLFDAS